jgi:hypothetical protein
LLVDQIGDVLDMDAGTYERPPENLDPAARELIRGVYKLKDRLLLILDTEKAVEVGSIESDRNGKLDAPSSEPAQTPRRAASAISDAGTADTGESMRPKNSTKAATKKAPAKKTNGAGRATHA